MCAQLYTSSKKKIVKTELSASSLRHSHFWTKSNFKMTHMHCCQPQMFRGWCHPLAPRIRHGTTLCWKWWFLHNLTYGFMDFASFFLQKLQVHLQLNPAKSHNCMICCKKTCKGTHEIAKSYTNFIILFRIKPLSGTFSWHICRV